MRSVRYTLLGDGSSDRALVPVLDWLIRTHLPPAVIQEEAQVADLGRLPSPPPLADLPSRIQTAIEFYPCDALFVHRDAEQAGGYAARRTEIERAIEASRTEVICIPVVPVRMTEAWLLFDEPALRAAAGNPGAAVPLHLPTTAQRERVHAKHELAALLQRAAALTGRRARQFRTADATQRLARLIDDFSPLRQFASFRDLELEIRALCETWRSTDAV